MTAPDLVRDGYALVPGVVGAGTLSELSAATARLVTAGRGGARSALDVPVVRRLAERSIVREAAEAVLGTGCFAVRGLLFDKTPDANWRVAWHQDLTIAVTERREVPGFAPWSLKSGIPHTQPPAAVLEQMVAVRLHLDPCGPDNGPLRVLPGTHLRGKLGPDAIDAACATIGPVDCCAPIGGLLLMRPLLLHASSPARLPEHRRVLHIEYAVGDLPVGLEWHERAARSAQDHKESSLIGARVLDPPH